MGAGVRFKLVFPVWYSPDDPDFRANSLGAHAFTFLHLGDKEAMKRIYVGNLAPSTKESALQTLFERYGHVSKAGIICNRDTGEKLGFGFVIMRNDLHGDMAIRGLEGSNFNGHRLHVLEALPPALKPESGFQRPQNPLDRFRAM